MFNKVTSVIFSEGNWKIGGGHIAPPKGRIILLPSFHSPIEGMWNDLLDQMERIPQEFSINLREISSDNPKNKIDRTGLPIHRKKGPQFQPTMNATKKHERTRDLPRMVERKGVDYLKEEDLDVSSHDKGLL